MIFAQIIKIFMLKQKNTILIYNSVLWYLIFIFYFIFFSHEDDEVPIVEQRGDVTAQRRLGHGRYLVIVNAVNTVSLCIFFAKSYTEYKYSLLMSK